jgi:hypothetical protein
VWRKAGVCRQADVRSLSRRRCSCPCDEGGSRSEAHQDPCHRLHSCPSDHNTYVCGDTGRCDQCPDNLYCLAGKPRVAASPAPAPTPPAPIPGQPSSPGGMTVCFTPGGNCTDLIVKALSEAKSSILVQA